MARPVVGGHFAFLALERACGGKAVQALDFLNEAPAFEEIEVATALLRDREEEINGGRMLKQSYSAMGDL